MPSNEDLPGELILQIQLRLPAKSLMRFCCVSKNWLSTISDPKFKKAHFKLASQQQTLSPRLLISSESQIKSLELDAPYFGDRHFVRRLTSPFQRPINTRSPMLLGSYHGLVLTLLNPGLYIWNPTTNCAQSIAMPSLDEDIVADVTYNCGIGHVSATDDYKIVVRSDFCREWRSPDSLSFSWSKRISVVEIFSLRANSWKSKDAPVFRGTPFCAGVVLNETLHWVEMFGDDESSRQAVLAFDLVKEEFGEIALPNVDHEYMMSDRDICVLSGGCLGLTAFSYSGFIQCWVMTEYDVAKSWTKLFKLYVGNPHQFMQLVFVSESCVIVEQIREHERYLVRFDRQEEDPDDELVVVCTGQYNLEQRPVDMIQYDESLLSLDDIRP